MTRIVFLSIIAASLAACSSGRINYHQFDGIYFDARARAPERGSAEFVVRVKNAERSLEGAREAAYYEAVQYCIVTYGTSDIVWTDAPDADEDALLIEDGSLVVAGTCIE